MLFEKVLLVVLRHILLGKHILLTEMKMNPLNQNLGVVSKAVLRGKCIALVPSILKEAK